MGDVTDLARYRSRREFDRNLARMGWSPTRLCSSAVSGTAIYLFDDASRLLLFTLVQSDSLRAISRRVRQGPQQPLFDLAETLDRLIADFIVNPSVEGDRRMAPMADAVAWFAGLSLSLIDTPILEHESIAIIRLVDAGRGESAFHLAHLEWSGIVAREQASRRLAGMARTLRRQLLPDHSAGR